MSAEAEARVIWKFPLSITGEQFIAMPCVRRHLTVQAQRNQPVLWTIVNPSSKTEDVRILCRGTGNLGQDIDLDWEHLGTVQIDGFVWHYFVEFP